MINQQMPYVYLPLPISYETKRDWNKKGYRVLDLASMPDGYDNPADEPKAAEPEKPKRATKK